MLTHKNTVLNALLRSLQEYTATEAYSSHAFSSAGSSLLDRGASPFGLDIIVTAHSQPYERRKTPRVHAMLAVTLHHRDGETEATSLDISSHGMAVWAQGVPPRGRVEIVLELEERPLRLVGRITRNFVSDGGGVLGIAFESRDQQALRAVERFVFCQLPLAEVG